MTDYINNVNISWKYPKNQFQKNPLTHKYLTHNLSLLGTLYRRCFSLMLAKFSPEYFTFNYSLVKTFLDKY